MDAIAFTGGVGENSPGIRSKDAEGLKFLGVKIVEERNRLSTETRVIADESAKVTSLVVLAREDLQIASEVRDVLDKRASQ